MGKENMSHKQDTERVKKSGKHDDYQSLAGSKADQMYSSNRKDKMNPLSASNRFQNSQ